MYRTETPEVKIRKAVTSLLNTQKFFGALALRMTAEPGPVSTIAGDGEDFSYNPEWVAKATVDEVKGCIAHIVMACSLHHQTRRGYRDNRNWQIASRLATAPMLTQSDFWLPDEVKDFMANGQYDNLPVEIIYERLESDEPPQQEGGAPPPLPPPPQQGDESSQDESEGSTDENEDDPKDQDGDGDPDNGEDSKEDGQDESNQSSGGDGDQDGDEDSDGDQDGDPDGDGQKERSDQDSPIPGAIQDAPAGQKDQQEADWDKAVVQALQITVAAGEDTADIEKVFEGKHDSFNEWEEQLLIYMKAVAPTDYSWRRPNRRFIAMDIYLPSLIGTGMGPVVILIDTSISVNDEYVNQACANVFRICQDVRPERIWMIQCDHSVKDVQDFDPLNAPDEIAIKGRGGTAFQPAFDKVAELGIVPDITIYFTDGENGIEPVTPPPYPVIWAVQNERQAESVEKRIGFGQTLVVPMESKP